MSSEQKELMLNADFINEEVSQRSLTNALAQLAIELAQQAGEAVSRPLTREQLARAVLANTSEMVDVMNLCRDRWNRLDAENSLPPWAYFRQLAGVEDSSPKPDA
ncbi:MAG TPA: hypothetical protein VFI49_08150 [Rudaea sp.]|nr:hypothetical protein [Rudaea sp.]